jgi:hypothetical protein
MCYDGVAGASPARVERVGDRAAACITQRSRLAGEPSARIGATDER